RIVLGRGERLTEALLERSGGIDKAVEEAARDIVADVVARGDAALRDYTARFDGVELDELRVTRAEIDAAYADIDGRLAGALRRCAARIREFHEQQVQQSWYQEPRDGVMLGQQVTPLRRVGVYVPGGRADYPSTVLMNVIPATVAGVAEIAVVAPPGAGGRIAASTLVAADMAGATEIYKVGGAQAIAALAYGTQSIPAVDKITGPGNAYVAAAKRLVQGVVGIDMIAGPSEVLVLADESAQARLVAIDLMAQAEHDPRAATYLVTTQPSLIEEVERELDALLEQSSREAITRAALTDNSVALVCETLEDAVAAANVIAPEHLEVLVREPRALLGSLYCAGALFLGPWTPEPVGDYSAGPNHTLPTQGTARFSSPLSADDFLKKSSVLSYTEDALRAEAGDVITMAETEGLWAHGMAVRLRVGDTEGGVGGSRGVARVRERAPLTPPVTARSPRPAVDALRPYEADVAREACLVMSANESPFTLPEPLLARLEATVRDFAYRRYPDPLASTLREKLARQYGIAPDSVLVGNGADELLLDLMLAWGGPGRRVLLFPPTFSMYGIYARTLETTVSEIDRDPETFAPDIDAAVGLLAQGDVDLCIIDTPNNPSGALTAQADLIRLLEASDALIVVDEAYCEFCGETALPLLERYPNLVILRTFSKAFSLAGLRLGFALAAPEVTATLAKVRMPYSVNAFSQWAGELATDERAAFEPGLEQLRSERERLYAALAALPGVRVWPSAANYLLLRVEGAGEVAQRLLDDHGVLVRDFSAGRGTRDCLRVTVGTPQDNDRFLDALAQTMKGPR
ncbi:MAG: histidinol dehydrogenase, partial [Actinomycetia bacterium]|nr:histidinol dehydrogenase [Actinomycetes bacterium]